MDISKQDAETVTRLALQELLEDNELTYLGNGPKATGGTTGWAMSPDLYFKCVICGYLMQASTDDYDRCFCGAMSKDAAAGRFGSNLGDARIEVYRVSRKI